MDRLGEIALTLYADIAAGRHDAGGGAAEAAFGDAALQIRRESQRTMPKEAKAIDPEPIPPTIEARVEWLESAVESILSAVQVRPSNIGGAMSKETKPVPIDIHDD